MKGKYELWKSEEEREKMKKRIKGIIKEVKELERELKEDEELKDIIGNPESIISYLMFAQLSGMNDRLSGMENRLSGIDSKLSWVLGVLAVGMGLWIAILVAVI